MLNYIKLLWLRLIGIDIVEVFSLNALATLIRMLAGMLSVKVVAVIIGPSGIALLGQLNSFCTIVLGLANGGISSGITKYVAEYKEDSNHVKALLSNAFIVTMVCSLITGLFLVAGCQYLSQLLFLADNYSYVFVVFGFTIIFFSLNNLLISILNGYKQFKRYVKVNIVGTIVGLAYSIILVTTSGLPGAMINAVTFQSIMFFVTLWMCRKMPWMKRTFFLGKYNSTIVRKYLGYSLMTLTSLALLPSCQMFLRGYVITELTAVDAGIWEGMNRISSMYLSVITTALSIYYLPRMSEIEDPRDLHNEIFRCYKIVVPMLLAICIAIFLLRFHVLWLLFTPDFYSMEKLFGWQLAGDLIKICSWMLSFLMVAKAKTTLFISTEIFFNITYLGLSFIFLQFNGVVGLTQGYLCNYIIYLIAMIFFFRNIIRIKTT